MSEKVKDVISNYLKYKENINTFSKFSLKAYKLDLNQAFENKLDYVCNYEDLWANARITLNKWGHLSLSSRNRKIATLKSFFGWLYEQNLIETDHSHQLVCPKVPKKLPHFLSVDEIIMVIKYLNHQLSKTENLQKKETFRRQKTIFLLLYGAGLRISEVCNLKWKNIYFNDNKILILGKGNKERYTVLPNFCMNHLNKIRTDENLKSSHYLFGEKPLNPRAGYELIRQLGREAGLIISLHPHALRHSYATHLLASGANLRVLQTLLGHESLQATEKYTHLSVDHLARLVEQSHPLSKLKISS